VEGSEEGEEMNTIFSAYCACALCCGQFADGLTASNTKPIQGITIAGPRSIPLGTRVLVSIPGYSTNVMIVQDRMARKWDGKRWDVYFRDHQKAREFGLKAGRVEIVK
jgi:3D (Asp-Asp-Asp) domain-containing protein